MEQLDIDALSDIELAVAVAVEVMGWHEFSGKAGDYPWYEVVPKTYAYDAQLRVYRAFGIRGNDVYWEPWHDMRAAWEIVEKMVADGWYFSVMTPVGDKGDMQWAAIFARRFDGNLFGHERLGDTSGVAIMRAALAAARSTR